MYLNYSSVENIPSMKASAAFTVDSASVFKEKGEISPIVLDDKHKYMPWGIDNNQPYDILKLIQSDETLSTCQIFNAEVCYGSGLIYDAAGCNRKVQEEVEDFFLDNDMSSYFLGVCQDFKHFAFCVSVIILSADRTKIVRIIRKEACYCRFAPVNDKGVIDTLYYAN